MKLFQLLFEPDREEAEQGQDEIAEAANLLQTGEFQLLQLAYYDAFGRDLPESETSRLFALYMIEQRVPAWARAYALRILERNQHGTLDDGNPAYHRYDRDYITSVPNGIRRFWLATMWCAAVLVGGIAVATWVVDEPTSLLPPYFERSEVSGQR